MNRFVLKGYVCYNKSKCELVVLDDMTLVHPQKLSIVERWNEPFIWVWTEMGYVPNMLQVNRSHFDLKDKQKGN